MLLIATGEGTASMLQISRLIFGTIAISLALGGVQFAAGHDLTGRQALNDAPPSIINRSAKTDRAAVVGSAAQTRTISLQLDSLADTSVLVRLPVAKTLGMKVDNGRSAPSMFETDGRKSAVACEPTVSVLTDIAKRLQPGRCVT